MSRVTLAIDASSWQRSTRAREDQRHSGATRKEPDMTHQTGCRRGAAVRRSLQRAKHAVLGTAVAALLPAAAWAQDGGGSSAPEPFNEAPASIDLNVKESLSQRDQDRAMDQAENGFAPTRDTIRSMATYGEMLKVAGCLSARGRSQVLKALASRPSSPEESRQYARTFDTLTTCGKQHTTILTLQRGSWSEAMYLKRHADALALTAPGRADEPFVATERAWNSEREAGDQAVIDATNCLTAARPGIVDAILRSSHGSDQETALMDQLFAAAPQCAGAVRPAKLSKTFLRAFLADSLYRAAEGETKLAIFVK